MNVQQMIWSLTNKLGGFMTKETQHVSEDATPPAQPAMDSHYMKQQQYKLHIIPV